MADLGSIGLSVGITITLQSLYLSVIKFPSALIAESNALQSLARIYAENAKEGLLASEVTGEATAKMAEANDLLTGNSAQRARGDLVWELTAIKGKLEGLSACREPDATYVDIVGKAVERTLSMLQSETMTPAQLRSEAWLIANMVQAAMRATSFRRNEERLKLADAVEVKSTSVDASLLEFLFAAAFCYIGILGIGTWVLDHTLLNTGVWVKVIIWLLIACIMSPVMVAFRKIGDSAKSVIQIAKDQTEATRLSLLKQS